LPKTGEMGLSGRHSNFVSIFFLSETMLVDGSMRDIEREMMVKWEIECTDIDP
jgi:hypothetical protein